MSMFCSYKGCSNVQRSFSSKTFFNLPLDSRRDAWIKNSGNDSLVGLSPKIRRVFCEDHFEPKYLRRQFNRTILWKEAIPFPYSPETTESQVEFEYIEMAESEEDVEQSQSDANESTNDDNNFTIVLNKSSNARNRLDKQSDESAKEIDITTSSTQIVTLNMDVKRKRNLLSLDDKDAEVDIIMVQEDSIKSEINEKEQISSKKLRTGIQETTTEQEPISNRLNESVSKVSSELIIIPSKSQKSQIKPDLLRSRISTDGIVSSTEAFDANNEETYFALSLLGTMRRLTPHKRAIAKCHILSYLTELEYGSS